MKEIAHFGNTTIFSLNGTWSFSLDGVSYPGHVPGDIVTDLYENHLIEDPFYGDNAKKIAWVHERDWTYETHFSLTEEEMSSLAPALTFLMMDTYATITLNGKVIGKTDSMFDRYTFPIKDAIQSGDNVLTVTLHSIRQVLRKVHNPRYHASFCDDRATLRKAQCHFGWDWAPNFPGTGIADSVLLYLGNGKRIDSVYPQTWKDGRISFLVELNLPHEEALAYHLRLQLEPHPNAGFDNALKMELPCEGTKNILNFRVENPSLWFPNGYGEQPLYHYRVELYDEKGLLCDIKEGRLGIREINIDESPFDATRRNFRFIVNGMPTFLTGSNFIPLSPCTGSIPNSLYHDRLLDAKEAGMNLLRVWGGGLYEKDIFYDLCDELGILVYQDFMFACQFVPDDNDGLRDKILREVKYQVRRLRSHPCLALYSAGNELGDAFATEKDRHYSLETQRVFFAGVVASEDPRRKFLWDSPYSLTDVGNDKTSGDCHCGSYIECSEEDRWDNFRSFGEENDCMFVSENSSLGACRYRSLVKFMPPDARWPLDNPMWVYRNASNPYWRVSSLTAIEKNAVAALFGEATDLKDFLKKSAVSQAEILASDLCYARAFSGCGGFLNWMYNDIWGTGTWSLIDVYGERKPAYYALKRFGGPKVAFLFMKEDKIWAELINDSMTPWQGKLNVSFCSLPRGAKQTLFETSCRIPPFERKEIPLPSLASQKDVLLLSFDGQTSSFFPHLWKGFAWESDLHIKKEERQKDGCYQVVLHLEANAYARVVWISAKEGMRIDCSDNAFDLPTGASKTVIVSSCQPLHKEDISLCTYADTWEE